MQKHKFKISISAWNKKYELPEYMIKKLQTVTDKSPIRTYVNKIENRIPFKIKKGYYLGLLTKKTMKLLNSTKNKITKIENGENVLHHCCSISQL